MKFLNHSLNKEIIQVIDECDDIKIANASNEDSIHKILNNSPMEIGVLSLKYSRLPNLYDSYTESGLRPIIFVDKDVNNFSASFSELQCYEAKEKKICYYSSDLRSTKKTSIKTRKEFRSTYSKVISYLKEENICFTAVLTANKKALNALTKKSAYFNYNPLFDYTSITTIASPLDYFYNPLTEIQITEVTSDDLRNKRDVYIKDQLESSVFSHEILTSEQREGQRDFLIFKKNEIISFFSTYRPRNRKLLVSSSNPFLDKFISFISKGKKELQWVYITNFITKDKNKLYLKGIKEFLKRSKITNTFDLILFSIHSNTISSPSLSVSTEARMFRVEKEQNERSIEGRIYLNPLCL